MSVEARQNPTKGHHALKNNAFGEMEMRILGKLFGSKSATNIASVLTHLDSIHRKRGKATMDLVRLQAIGDAELDKYAIAVAMLLKIQSTPAGSTPLITRDGVPNLRAIGYVWGAADAALQIIGKDMSDEAVGVPFASKVFCEFSPEHMKECMTLIIESARNSDEIMQGINSGGSEFLAYANSGGTARMPMGLSKSLLGSAPR